MQKFNGYDDIVVNRPRKIKSGLYKGKIIATKVDKVQTKNGEQEILRVYFDVAEGEFKDYYKILYDLDSREKKDKRWGCELSFFLENKQVSPELNKKSAEKFKRFINYIEKDNEGYKFEWDEKTLKDKTVGLAFSLEEFQTQDGRILCTTKLRYVTAMNRVEAFDPTNKALYPSVKCIDGSFIPYITYLEKLDEARNKVQEDTFITIENSDEIPF